MNKIKLIIIIVILLIAGAIYFYHLHITKPYRITKSFLHLINKNHYGEAIKMYIKDNYSPMLNANGEIIGIHFLDQFPDGSNYESKCYFSELKQCKIIYPSGLYYFIKINFIASPSNEKGINIIHLDKGYTISIENSVISYIDQKP